MRYPLFHAAVAALMTVVTSAVAFGVSPVVDLSSQTFDPAERVDDGQAFTFDMGTDRRNWNHARWSKLMLDTPLDLSDATALKLTVITDKPRSDAGVYLALQEADGSWYVHGWAANLTKPTNEGVAWFNDFRLGEWYSPGSHHDENALLDRDKITGIAIGVVNPLGVGEVSFTVTQIAAVKKDTPQPAPVQVNVTGKPLDVGGQATVPVGLFGIYYPKDNSRLERYRIGQLRNLWSQRKATPTTPIQIACWGERFNPSVMFKPNWPDQMKQVAEKFADRAEELDQPLYVEFWNEPYLNWATYTRINFKPDLYDESKAKEGGPVHIKHSGEVVPHLFWTKDYDKLGYKPCSRREWRRGVDESGRMYPNMHARPPHMRRGETQAWRAGYFPPLDVKDGETYSVTRQIRKRDRKTKKKVTVEEKLTLTAMTPWHIYDETQHTYWSGKGMVKLYVEPALAMGKALKAADPEAQYFVGWGFRPGEDHWAGWDLLYKPTLDALIDVADGIHEHDYGSDPLKLPAQYEVVQAYAVTKHNKPMKFINTEQAAQTDPQAYPEAAGDGLTQAGASDMNKYRWASRKLMHSIATMPEKAFAFSYFGGWWSDTGEGVMFEQLINLRGRLVHVDSPDPRLFIVASVDGTDPLAPRPESMPQRKELVVAVWNDHVTPREVHLNLTPPAGTTFSGSATVRTVAIDAESGRPKVTETPTDAPEADGGQIKRRLDPLSMVVYTLPLKGDPGESSPVRVRQFFSDQILVDVTPRATHTTTIQIDPQMLKKARLVKIRFVAERLARGEGTVTINGKTYDLPHAVTPENCQWVRELPVDVADIQQSNKLTFSVPDDAHAGYLLGMSSLIIEHE